mgnify:CR=1 FL=1
MFVKDATATHRFGRRVADGLSVLASKVDEKLAPPSDLIQTYRILIDGFSGVTQLRRYVLYLNLHGP